MSAPSEECSPPPPDVAVKAWKTAVHAGEWVLEVIRTMSYDGRAPEHKDSGTDSILQEEMPHITELRKVIPSHCFQADTKLSLFYVGRDLLMVVALYAFYMAVIMVSPPLVAWLSMPVYWFLQGTAMWAIFVLGHDCGHCSFSRYGLLNDVLGTFLHALLLVPYYPWKLSHRHHHKNTGNIDQDEIFYPIREKDSKRTFSPISPGFGLGIAWVFYLIKGYPPRKLSHFNPLSLMFYRNAWACIASLLSMAAWAYFLYLYSRHAGIACLLSHYLLPWFVFASWLVVVTFLHHSDTGVPWYGDDVWTNVRGQLASVDRDYGWAHSLTHNIGTHQIHHLFTRIPHYHLEEATFHFRRAYPHLARVCDAPIMPQYFKMFNIYRAQRHISDTAQLHVYQ